MVKNNYDNTLSRFHRIYRNVTDRQTDGQTELLYQYPVSVIITVVVVLRVFAVYCSHCPRGAGQLLHNNDIGSRPVRYRSSQARMRQTTNNTCMS